MQYRILAAIGLLFSTNTYAATPWENYLALPTPENAKRVAEIRFSQPQSENSNEIYAGLEIVRNQLNAGDIESLRLAVRLRHLVNGHLLEELTAIIGRSIRIHPKLFLRVIGEQKIPDEGLRSILQMPGLEYVDRMEAQAFEIAMRKQAIMNVTDPNLQIVKQKCLALFAD